MHSAPDRLARRLTAALAVCLLVPALATTTFALDSVQLTTGEILTGKVLRLNEREVSIKLDSGGILTFKAQNVRKVRRWLRGKEKAEVITFDNDRPDSGRPPHDQLPNALFPTTGPVGPGSSGRDGGALPLAGGTSPDDWYFEPPPGFEVVPPERAPEALRVWTDPVVGAKVVLVAHALAVASPESLRESVVAELVESKKIVRTIRDKRLHRGGEGGYKGWILEVEHSLSGRPVRQIQLFTSANDRSFVLSLTCPTDDYPALARFFEDSLQSFRVFERGKPEPPAAPAAAEDASQASEAPAGDDVR